MRAVVFGFSNVGERCLRLLVARGVEVALVVTHSDRSRDATWLRSVAAAADELGLERIRCDDPRTPALFDRVAAARPDVIFSFYYAAMIPTAVLELAPLGAFNLHGSLLPRFRGRAPTNWAVIEGATETGATLHWMVAAPDAGAIVDAQAVPILPDDTGRDVFDKVTVAAEQVLDRSLASIASGTAARLPNRLAEGRYYGRRQPDDGRIDWQRPAAEVYDLIRAVAPPYPGAFTEIGGQRFVIAAARLRRDRAPDPVPPGLSVIDGAIVGRCGDDGLVAVRELRLGERRVGPTELQACLDRAAGASLT